MIGLESLKKFDMIVNFVDLIHFEESMRHLAQVPLLEDLHFMGNPCMDWAPSKDVIIAIIP